MAFPIIPLISLASAFFTKTAASPVHYVKSAKATPVATTTTLATGTILGNLLATQNNVDVTEIALETLELIETITMKLIG